MSQTPAVPYDCERCPTECSPTQVPGPEGPAGPAATNGTNGINAFTFLTAGFVMPNIGSSVVAEVEDTSWMVPEQGLVYGQALAVEFAGTLLIANLVDGTHIEIINLGYEGNASGGAAIPAGGKVSPSGVQGPSAPPGGGALLSVNNLNDVTNVAASRANLGLGTAATKASGDFFQVSNNLSEGTAATKRTNLGLGTVAVENAGIASGNVAKNDGALTPGDSVWATASGLQTKSAANALIALGLTGGVAGSYILCQDHQAIGVASGNFVSGGWVTVPVNTKVSDPAGIATLAANVLTLPTGIYRVRASVLGFQVAFFQARLFNISDAVSEFSGSSGYADGAVLMNAASLISGRLIVTGGPKNYRLEAQCLSTKATDGFGSPSGFGPEVYASWELEKEQ